MELPSDCSDTYILRREGTGAVEGTLFPQTISRNNHGKILLLLQGINRTGENGDAVHEKTRGMVGAQCSQAKQQQCQAGRGTVRDGR